MFENKTLHGHIYYSLLSKQVHTYSKLQLHSVKVFLLSQNLLSDNVNYLNYVQVQNIMKRTQNFIGFLKALLADRTRQKKLEGSINVHQNNGFVLEHAGSKLTIKQKQQQFFKSRAIYVLTEVMATTKIEAAGSNQVSMQRHYLRDYYLPSLVSQGASQIFLQIAFGRILTQFFCQFGNTKMFAIQNKMGYIQTFQFSVVSFTQHKKDIKNVSINLKSKFFSALLQDFFPISSEFC